MSGAELERRIRQLVDDCCDRGHLPAATWGKTMTLDGRRRYTIRLQVDIVSSAFFRSSRDHVYYPDLTGLIDQAVDEWRASR